MIVLNTRAGLSLLSRMQTQIDICELIGWNKNFVLHEHKEIYKWWYDVICSVRFEVKNRFFCCILILTNAYQMIWIGVALLLLTGIHINVASYFISLHGRSF